MRSDNIISYSFSHYHQFVAFQYLEELENFNRKEDIVQLSLQYGFLTEYTCYLFSTESPDSTIHSHQFISIDNEVKKTNRERNDRKYKYKPKKRKVQKPSRQKNLQFILVDGIPCTVIEESHSKTGKHGSAKVHLKLIDPSTGKQFSKIMKSNDFQTAQKKNSQKDADVENIRGVDRLIRLQVN